MPQGQDGHEHRVLAETAGTATEAGVEHVIVVGARDQFRQRSRAARKQHGRHFRRIGAQRREDRLHRCWPASAQLIIARKSCCPAAGSPTTNTARRAGKSALDFHGHRAVVESTDPVRNHICNRARGAHEVPDLAVPMGAQRHHRNGADARQREIGVDKLGTLGSCSTTRSSGRMPASMNRQESRSEVSAKLPVAQALPRADEGGLLRVARGAAGQHLRDGDAFPPATGTVARRLIGGPGHAAVEHCLLLRISASRVSGKRSRAEAYSVRSARGNCVSLSAAATCRP